MRICKVNSKDPWAEISPPSPSNQYNANLVDHPDLTWEFFWAKGPDSKCALILNHKASSNEGLKLPKLKGVEVSFISESGGQNANLLFKLHETEHRDIFYQLCKDIVESTTQAESEREAVSLTIARAWRWHHLLRGGSDGRLSLEEQKGLIGELIVLERLLLTHMSPVDAVNSWTGPLDAPKDFEIGNVCIESKARRGAATPFVTINSEFQLDDDSVDQLYLHVVELNRTPPSSDGSFNITEIATRVREKIQENDPGAISAYDGLLSSSGFDWDDDYSDSVFLEGSHTAYLVQGNFPRITQHNFHPGPSRVRYSLSLTECEPYQTTYKSLSSAIKKVNDGE